MHAGFADLIVISGGRVLLLEVKSQTGRLRKSQEVFRDTVCAQGFGWHAAGYGGDGGDAEGAAAALSGLCVGLGSHILPNGILYLYSCHKGNAMQFATIQPTVSRPDLPAITDEEAAALARTTVNLFRAWQLSDIEARVLLGDMAQRTWARWKDGGIGRIDRDLRARMAILLRIRRCCTTLAMEDSQRESIWLDGVHEQTITRPLPHYELVQLHGGAPQARVAADLAGQGDGLACAA